jgi:uncharacterized PurR-regulated membrane protein YhhQ (DUF165 family)
MKAILIGLYLAAIAGANVLTAKFAPLEFGSMLVPAGTFLIGATFMLRDFVQKAIGRRNTYMAIAAAMALSAVTSYALGDTLWIVFASAVTFMLSETADTEIFTRQRGSMARRVLFSGLVGGSIDSAVFVLVGLSPLGAGFLPWEAIWQAIAGQMLLKAAMQALGAAALVLAAGRKPVAG